MKRERIISILFCLCIIISVVISGSESHAASGWRSDAGGWWYEYGDSYYKNQWANIGGCWYYFTASGYMDYSEYRDGCWLGADGAWNEAYYGGHWKSNSVGWWYEDSSGWYPVSTWLWIDGNCYYFKSSGYMATNEWIDGCYVDNNGAWINNYKENDKTVVECKKSPNGKHSYKPLYEQEIWSTGYSIETCRHCPYTVENDGEGYVRAWYDNVELFGDDIVTLGDHICPDGNKYNWGCYETDKRFMVYTGSYCEYCYDKIIEDQYINTCYDSLYNEYITVAKPNNSNNGVYYTTEYKPGFKNNDEHYGGLKKLDDVIKPWWYRYEDGKNVYYGIKTNKHNFRIGYYDYYGRPVEIPDGVDYEIETYTNDSGITFNQWILIK